jgi:hypothetical protein
MARPPNSFLETIIAFLLPYFIAASRDKQEARSEILDTLASYETRTRAEMLQAAHIIALGMTTLDVLAEAKTAEMSQWMRLRYRSCANSLNRSTLRTEKALDQRLGDEIPAAPAEMAEPIDDMREAEIMAVIQQHKAEVDAKRPRVHPATAPHPATNAAPDQAWNPELWANAMINSLQQPAGPVQPSP